MEWIAKLPIELCQDQLWIPCPISVSQDIALRRLAPRSFTKPIAVSIAAQCPSLFLAALLEHQQTDDEKFRRKDLLNWLTTSPAFSAIQVEHNGWQPKTKAKQSLLSAADQTEFIKALCRFAPKRFRKQLRSQLQSTQISERLFRELQCGLADPKAIAPDIHVAPLFTELANLRTLEAEFETELERRKLNSMRLLAYGASHEINNPLANISTRAQTLLNEIESPSHRHRIAVIYQQAMRAHEMISDMMLFAHPPKICVELVDLKQLVETIIVEIQAAPSQPQIKAQIEFQIECSDQVLVHADPTQMAAAIKAMLQNSVQAIQDEGNITVNIDTRPEVTRVRIHDTGRGVSDEIVNNIFDPFFSGREAGRGLGFGLSKAWRIAQLHGGDLQLVNTDDTGTTFEFCLPVRVKLAHSQSTDTRQVA